MQFIRSLFTRSQETPPPQLADLESPTPAAAPPKCGDRTLASTLAPQRFGIWEVIPGTPDRLQTRISHADGFSYTLTFSSDPATGLISYFDLRSAPGLDVPTNGAPTLPNATLSFTSLDFSRQTLGALFAAAQGAGLGDRSLLQEVERIWTIAPLANFEANLEVLRHRLSRTPNSSGVELIEGVENNFPPELAAQIFERVLQQPPAQQLRDCGVLKRNIRKVSEAGREMLANRVLERLSDLLTPPALVEALFEKRGKAPPLLVEAAPLLSRDMVEKLLAVLTRPPLSALKGRQMSLLVDIAGKFPEELQRLVCKAATEVFVALGDLPRLLSLVSGASSAEHVHAGWFPAHLGVGAHGGLHTSLRCWPIEAAHALSEKYFISVVQNANAFEGLDILATVQKALELPDGLRQVAQALPHLTGIPGSIGVYLADKLQDEAVLNNMKSFEWRVADIQALLEGLERTGQTPALLPRLHSLPDRLLQAAQAKWYLKSYAQEVGIANVTVYYEYLPLVRAKDVAALAAFKERIVKMRTDAIVGNPISPEVAADPFYRPILESIYHNHSSRSTSIIHNERCPDRSADIASLKRQAVYPLRISQAVEMVLRPGTKEDQRALARVEAPLQKAQERLAPSNWDREAITLAFDRRLDQLGPLVARFRTSPEKLFGAFILASLGKLERPLLKELIAEYQLATHPPMREHLALTRAEAESAKNPRYAYLMALHEYYNDMLYDSVRSLCEVAAHSKEVVDFLCKQYPAMRALHQKRMRQASVHRFRAHNLGLSPALLEQVQRLLARDQNEGGEAHPFSERLTRVGALLHSEQQKIAQFIEAYTGARPDPDSIHLGEFSLASVLKVEPARETTPSAHITLSYAKQELEQLFKDELHSVGVELRKYRPRQELCGRAGLRLNAYLSKNKASAHARMVGGVCVSGDNPGAAERHGWVDEGAFQPAGGAPAAHQLDLDALLDDGGNFVEPPQLFPLPQGTREERSASMWELPNFFQLVLHDAESGRCEGVVMLHHYHDHGKKILTASLNPTASVLFKTSEAEFFKGLLKILAQIAEDNGFDMVCSARNRGIRTNRTGGEFERTFEAHIRKVNKTYSLRQPEIFSYRPRYTQQELDVLWERK